MYFRNITLFRFPAESVALLRNLEAKLAEHPVRPCGPLELSTRGWLSPFGRGEQVLAHGVGHYLLLALGVEDKVLPAAVVNRALADKLDALEKQRGKPVGGRERRKLKDEVLTDLMPRALSKRGRLLGYLDTANGWIVVDTASRKAGEMFVSKLREALGSLPAVQAEAEESPRSVMTDWLIDGELPKGWVLGDECELKDPADQGAVVRCRRQEMESDEVREHLKSGKQVAALGLVFEERMRFVLDENLTIRKFKLLDVVTESLDAGERASANAELDARFALLTHEVATLLEALASTFSVPRPVGG